MDYSSLDTPDTVVDEYNFLKEYMTLGQEQRMLIGHKFENLIKACTFREKDCLEEKFFMGFNDPSFGNCFTFNTELNNHSDTDGGKRKSSLTGSNFGLSVVLNIVVKAAMPTNQ